MAKNELTPNELELPGVENPPAENPVAFPDFVIAKKKTNGFVVAGVAVALFALIVIVAVM